MPITNNDWPQHGRDAQRSNYSPLQVDGPYAYSWKWFEVPIAQRAQPVVVDDKLFIGSLDGKLYARNALTGAALWSYQTGGPIRHTAAVIGGRVITQSQDGYVYAITIATGVLDWSRSVGPSATAPLVDETLDRIWVASSTGNLVCLTSANVVQWQAAFQGAILTTPTLSADGTRLYLGTEEMYAYAVNAASGFRVWQTKLPGQSMADRYPVVAGNTVIFRTQPIKYFHLLLQGLGDDVMDAAGAINSNWATDWGNVKTQIVNHLTANPDEQTCHVLNKDTGKPVAVAPVLYTYGSGGIPAAPVVRGNGDVFIFYRARHGIQTDGGTVHVTTDYDAEIGQINLSTLDITGLTAAPFNREWRATSDEDHGFSFSGNLLLIDSWTHLGGINLQANTNFYVGKAVNNSAIANDPWTISGSNWYFPLDGGAGNGRPFPLNVESEGHHRPGVVVASGRLYWKVAAGGIACIAPSGSAGTLQVHTVGSIPGPSYVGSGNSARAMSEFVTLDLTTPAGSPDAALVTRLKKEVGDLVRLPGHPMPMYIERGFDTSYVWPSGNPANTSELPEISYNTKGRIVWHDIGELLQTVAMAYPYLGTSLQAKAKAWMEAEMEAYSPIETLPQYQPSRDWLRTGLPREPYAVPMRGSLNNFPGVQLSLGVFYAIWLWCKNTGDWSFADTNQTAIRALYNDLRTNVRYYNDIAGMIGYARIAAARSWSDAASSATNATTALTNSTNLATMKATADGDFLDPSNWDGNPSKKQASGEQLPVLFGLVPEIGLYLSEKTSGAAKNAILLNHHITFLPAWFCTKLGQRFSCLNSAGAAGETTETCIHTPQTAWAGFLGEAYVMGETRANLTKWLDHRWCVGDLYSIQKIVATIQAP